MGTPKLLTREDFREQVFNRDNHTCVFCTNAAKDAHHILERRLWPDGGYYIDNGASVCEMHHLLCEQTIISVEEVRLACGITSITIPPHLYSDQIYDKWGNPVLPSGKRMRGELFYDESVQKILQMGDVLQLFVEWVKYPRTYHLPWTQSMTDDDRILPSVDVFRNKRVVVTRKMDGENTTMYPTYIHARSVDGRSHPSRSWVKQFWSTISYDIPNGWRVCGENVYAEHSISYTDLTSYFMGFSIWNDQNICISWDETLEWFNLLGIEPVPVLYDGMFDEKIIQSLWNPSDYTIHEGYVLRIADEFAYGDFNKSVSKFVRKGHVQTQKHWMHGQRVVPNKLKPLFDDSDLSPVGYMDRLITAVSSWEKLPCDEYKNNDPLINV